MELKVICKRLITQNLDENITEGEYGADIVGITVPRMYGEHDLSSFSFRLTAISKLNESVAEQVLAMDSADDENIHLLWEITSDFTASSGEVTLILAGINSDNTVQIKFISQPVKINDDSRLEFIESPTILEQAYNQVQLEVQKALDAAERAEKAASKPIIVPVAAETEIGGILSGGDISVNENGDVTVNSVGGKTLGISVPEDAVFTDTVYALPVASETVLGGVKTDNETIRITEDGTIFATASSSGRELNGNSSYSIHDAVEYPILDLTIYGKSVQNGVPTPEVPVDIVSVGDNGTISVTACGKNLLPYPYVYDSMEISGLRFTVNADTTITISGTATATTTFRLYGDGNNVKALAGVAGGKTYKLSENVACKVINSAGQVRYVNTTVNLAEDEVITYVYVQYGANVTVNTTLYPMIYLADADDTFEAYKGNTAEITSGLPLCSVGDVCDELIYNADGTGKIIKRTAKFSSYNGEEITTAFISSTGSLDTGAEIVYLLDVPQEIKLSDEETTALLKLHTYNSTTNINTDRYSETAVKYCTNTVLSEYVYPVLKNLLKHI